MAAGEQKLKRKKRSSIFTKLFLTYLLAIMIPLVISDALIAFSYQNTMDEFLVSALEQGLAIETERDLSSMLQNIKTQAAMTLLIIGILAFFGTIFMTRHIVRPIKRITMGTSEIAKGNLDFEVEVASRDELGELANYFNEMTHQLKEARVALEESKESLEIRVRARTKELQELAEQLEDKVHERTQQLQARVEELERFHRLTVGRELKMIELKEALREAEEAIREFKATEPKKSKNN